MNRPNIENLEQAGTELAGADEAVHSLILAAARDGYVRQVTERVFSNEPIHHHADIDWWEERQKHIEEKYGLSPALASVAIIAAETVVEAETFAHGEA